jgi:hypothetical protein
MKPILAVIIAIVAAVVFGAGGFFAGTAYGSAQAQNTRDEFLRNRQGGTPGQFGQNGPNGQAGQFGRPAAVGTVKSVNGNTLTVTQQDGTTVTVTVNQQTTIQKTTTGAISDIQPGQRITVESDQTGGNIVARGIQIRPSGQQ